jgi:ABC-type antimicrobial peptide transport system permease subunit
MLKNYFITAWRNLRRQHLTTLVNITGLALAITCTLIIYLMVTHALSYNDHFENNERLYRLVGKNANNPGRNTNPGVPPPLPEAMKEDISGIDAQVFISALSTETLIRTGSNESNFKYFQKNEYVAYTEPSFFDVFSFAIVQGSTGSFFEPKKIIITESVAKTLFPDGEALGQVIQINGEAGFEIIAVMEDSPEASDIPFEMLISYSTIKEKYLAETGWGSVSSDDQVYMLLKDNVTPEEINTQFVSFVQKHYENDENPTVYNLQHASDWHVNDNYGNYSHNTFPKAAIITVSLIAVFLIITGCVNFINLKTALALHRTREIGIRKVLGSGKWQLILQNLGETFLVVLAATLISLGLTEVLLIQVNSLLEADMHITFSAGFVAFLIGLMLLVTILSGLYPAMVIANYQPALAIKNVASTSGRKGATLRKGLVTFQFFISQFFIIGTIVLIAQTDYIASLDLGFSTNSILNVPVPDSSNEKKKSVKAELERLAKVEQVSLMYSTPASGSVSITDYSIGTEDELLTAIKIADQDYLTMYNIPLLAGEGLDESDTITKLVVNEKWTIQSGFDSPDQALGTMVEIWGYNVPVVGVVKDFHTVSVNGDIQAVTIMSGLGNVRQLGIKIRTGDMQETVAAIEGVWKKFYPEYTFEYEFLDEYIAGFYESEKAMTRIFSFFSVVAIVIGMLGLLGLIAFTTERRMKEVSVRKVMGASVQQIFMMFSWDVIKLVFVAFLFAAPLAWYLMTKWLENYTFRIELELYIFFIGLALTSLIAILTISYRSWKAAYTNPAESLRSE